MMIAFGLAFEFPLLLVFLQLAGILEMLAEFYRSHLVEVTDLIHNRAGRKAQQFADAFKLRRDS